MPEKALVIELADSWRTSLAAYPSDLRLVVERLVEDEKHALAAYFYARMMQDKAGRTFLSHEVVHNRLSASMARWLHELFSIQESSDFRALVELQHHVGQVHARIDLPLHLVLMGARYLKLRISELLETQTALEAAERAIALCYVHETIDIAMEFMSRAYSVSYDRKSRSEESYRVFAAVHNTAAERGRQRAALLDWENQIMFELASRADLSALPRANDSDFGLWFAHKGAYAFQGNRDIQIIQQTLDELDNEVLPDFFNDNANQLGTLRRLRTLVRLIQMNMDELFDQRNELESGRDALTHLLGRKYLPVILGKEVAYARNRGISFALLAIDLDYFKQVNDRFGHESGDAVLRQMGELLNGFCRAGDYVFRLGGEEFMVLLVDVTRDSALRIATALQELIRREPFKVSGNEQIQLTASMGLTLYDGHPDYAQSLSRADRALYQAKELGRNRIEIL